MLNQVGRKATLELIVLLRRTAVARRADYRALIGRKNPLSSL